MKYVAAVFSLLVSATGLLTSGHPIFSFLFSVAFGMIVAFAITDIRDRW